MKNKEMERKAPFVGFWHYGVILTYLSAAAGIVGIFLCATVGPFWGVVCLFVSGLCDAFDGVVAGTRKNRSEQDKKFGQQIDSLSDLVAFGVAPVAIGFFKGMNTWYFMIPLCIFTLCALIRLAYYNVTEEERVVSGAEKRTSFEGLPVTNVAIGIPTFYVIATMFADPLVTAIVLTAGYLLTAFLMVFRFRMPKAGPKGVLIAIGIFTAVIISLVLIRTYVCDIPLTAHENIKYVLSTGGGADFSAFAPH